MCQCSGLTQRKYPGRACSSDLCALLSHSCHSTGAGAAMKRRSLGSGCCTSMLYRCGLPVDESAGEVDPIPDDRLGRVDELERRDAIQRGANRVGQGGLAHGQ